MPWCSATTKTLAIQKMVTVIFFTIDDIIDALDKLNLKFDIGLDHVDKGRRTGGVGLKIN